MIRFVVEGRPVGKGRPRVLRSGRVYTPQRTKAYEALVALAARQAMMDQPPLVGPLAIRIELFLTPPQWWPKVRRALAVSNSEFPAIRPDIDNIAKAICDALNGVAYVDDSQLCELAITKQYAEADRAVIELRELRRD